MKNKYVCKNADDLFSLFGENGLWIRAFVHIYVVVHRAQRQEAVRRKSKTERAKKR